VGSQPLAEIAQHKGKGAMRVSRKIVHVVLHTVGGKRESPKAILAHDYVKNGELDCPRPAITAQQSCSIDMYENLLAPDGISKTTV
jgi:hypothetical protein